MTAATRVATSGEAKDEAARLFAQQSNHLGLYSNENGPHALGAAEAKFVTAQDAIIETVDGGRLPAVPVEEAAKLNRLKDEMEGRDPSLRPTIAAGFREAKDGTIHGAQPKSRSTDAQEYVEVEESILRYSKPPMMTSPLFPPLPMYGPPSFLRDLQCYLFRFSSAILSFCFLMILLLGAAFTSLPLMLRNGRLRLKMQDPSARRPFHGEEERKRRARRQAEEAWRKSHRSNNSDLSDRENGEAHSDKHAPLEGGKDPLVCDVGYYARRVGLDMEEFDVQTEDGFTICLWHVYDPREYAGVHPDMRRQNSASIFREDSIPRGKKSGASGSQYKDGERQYPVLLMPGLLQSGGAYCCNDDNSLAFFLAKSGYDVWIGNNRCGFAPRHNLLKYGDPRMWTWNIRQMGVIDLPAFISRVLLETGFEKLGLICHSQGTTETFVALAKEQRPDIGEKISVFCALAPAVYAGPLIRKMYFKFMQVINPSMFRLIFGIHAFIPFMMQMHSILPARIYGFMGYRIFSFLFNWSDERWERDLRDRMFQFAPTYVSAESMRWWLGRECFARHKCILATRVEGQLEDQEDREEDDFLSWTQDNQDSANVSCNHYQHRREQHERYSWYDERAPPFAFWIAGNDDLVDGPRLLRRFNRRREPHVKVVHQKVIDEYEHLDVIWAMDSIEKVGKEIREIVWKTASPEAKRICRQPVECE